jgi:hypothetical protein
VKPVHYYHIWAGDRYHGSAWQTPAVEHFAELKAAGFDGEVRIGLVGGQPERIGVMQFLRTACPQSDIVVQADEGFEMVTIDAMHKACQEELDPFTPVLYAHTKGALNRGPYADKFRRSMTKHVVGGWRECVKSLHSYDATGCHWLTHEQFPQYIDPRRPMFGGNFWWAKAVYLAGLPPVEYVSRWSAEGWMGQGFPNVADLLPGWPAYP